MRVTVILLPNIWQKIVFLRAVARKNQLPPKQWATRKSNSIFMGAASRSEKWTQSESAFHLHSFEPSSWGRLLWWQNDLISCRFPWWYFWAERSCHARCCHQGQLGAKCLVQRYFDMWRSRGLNCKSSIREQFVLPPEAQPSVVQIKTHGHRWHPWVLV